MAGTRNPPSKRRRVDATRLSPQLQGTDGMRVCAEAFSSRSCDVGGGPEGECDGGDGAGAPEGECRGGETEVEPAHLACSPTLQLGAGGTSACEEAVAAGSKGSGDQTCGALFLESLPDILLQCLRTPDIDVHSCVKRVVGEALQILFEEAGTDGKTADRCAVLGEGVKVLLRPVDGLSGGASEKLRLTELNICLRLELICAFAPEWEEEHSRLLNEVSDLLGDLQFVLEDESPLEYADRVVKEHYGALAPSIVERIYRQAELQGYNDQSASPDSPPNADGGRLIQDVEIPIGAWRSERSLRLSLEKSISALASAHSTNGQPWAPRARKEIFRSLPTANAEAGKGSEVDLSKQELCALRRERARRFSHFGDSRALNKVFRVPVKKSNLQVSAHKRKRSGAGKCSAAVPKFFPPSVTGTPIASSSRARTSVVLETPVRTVPLSTPSVWARLGTGLSGPSMMDTPKTAATTFQTVLGTPGAGSPYASSFMARTLNVLETPVRTVPSSTSPALFRPSTNSAGPSMMDTPRAAARPFQTVRATPRSVSPSASSFVARTSNGLETPIRTVTSSVSRALLRSGTCSSGPSVINTSESAATTFHTVPATPGAWLKSVPPCVPGTPISRAQAPLVMQTPDRTVPSSTPSAVIGSSGPPSMVTPKSAVKTLQTVPSTPRAGSKSVQFAMDTSHGGPRDIESASVTADGNTLLTVTNIYVPADNASTAAPASKTCSTMSGMHKTGKPIPENAAFVTDNRPKFSQRITKERGEQLDIKYPSAVLISTLVTSTPISEAEDVPTAKQPIETNHSPESSLAEEQGAQETTDPSVAEDMGPDDELETRNDTVHENRSKNLAKKRTPRLKPVVPFRVHQTAGMRGSRRSRISSVI